MGVLGGMWGSVHMYESSWLVVIPLLKEPVWPQECLEKWCMIPAIHAHTLRVNRAPMMHGPEWVTMPSLHGVLVLLPCGLVPSCHL